MDEAAAVSTIRSLPNYGNLRSEALRVIATVRNDDIYRIVSAERPRHEQDRYYVATVKRGEPLPRGDFRLCSRTQDYYRRLRVSVLASAAE